MERNWVSNKLVILGMFERPRSIFGYFFGQGDRAYDEADRLYVQAIEMLEKTLGPDHPDLATLLNNRAVLFESLVSTDARGMGCVGGGGGVGGGKS